MGNESSKSKGHTLGGSANSSGSLNNNQTQKKSSGSNPSLQQQQRQSVVQQIQPKPANSEEDREQRLAAIEARMGASEKRGVQKGGGKLAQKLEENKRTNGGDIQQRPQQGDDVADMWKN
ncbi:UNVERIFIED_CONTAM: hypothetical protein HDU68_003455 [Siphonaria sp. JEL0065]|nr:hypothetical protein HDU68_003455 [Siphonaria sp. JEL0065]